MVHMAPKVTQVTDINTGPSYSRTMDPYMPLMSSDDIMNLDDILTLGRSSGHTDQDGSGGGKCPLDSNKATDCSPAPGLPCDFWWQH